MARRKKKNNRHKESIQEYESLRNEIISLHEIQRNIWINMYILFCTLFVLGLQWSHYLFLVTYIILIPFQCVINDFRWTIFRIATYIRVFFEEENKGLNWETLQVHSAYQEYYKNRNNSLDGLIRVSGAVHLGFLSTGFFCGCTLISNYYNGKFSLNGLDIFLMLLSVFVLSVVCVVNGNYYKRYDDKLEKIIRQYKNEVIS